MGSKMKTITIMVPCYNEEDMLEVFIARTKEVTDNIPEYEFKYLFINDGSSDDTLPILRKLNAQYKEVEYIYLTRNFGKESAMLAGFDYVDSDAVVLMDADLQDPPSLLPSLIHEWEIGYDDVYAKRKHRKGETWFKKYSSKIYYRILSKVSDIPVLVDVGDFRLLDKKCVDALRRLRETQRYTKGLFSWIGYKKKAILYDRDARVAGKTKWNYWKLFRLAINGITSFSSVPLQISSWLGIIVSCSAFIYMIRVIVKTLLYGDPVQGYPSMVVIILFVSGVQLIVLGVIGEYVGNIYRESKNRPIYLVDECSDDFKRQND